MTDYSETPEVFIASVKRTSFIEMFFGMYPKLQPQDIYHWLWLGEFGSNLMGIKMNDDLEKITQDMEEYYIMSSKREGTTRDTVKKEVICEPLGMTNYYLKINLLAYNRAGCPLKRLLRLQSSSNQLRPDNFRMLQDWDLCQKIAVLDNRIKQEDFTLFEKKVALNMLPKMDFSREFISEYQPCYRVVPRKLFFRFFSEYESSMPHS